MSYSRQPFDDPIYQVSVLITRRLAAIESLLVRKGLLTPEEIDEIEKELDAAREIEKTLKPEYNPDIEREKG